ncbi:MAG: hypothetical protein ACKOOL_07255 [Novosphingobium sp.]
MVTRLAAAAALAVCLAGCSHNNHLNQTSAAARPAPRPQALGAIPARPAASVWHLRAGLNVAALTCKGRGRVSVRGPYGEVLSRHRALLAAAYSAEQQRQGNGFDHAETRLYNRFSNQRDPARFCRDAASVARRAAAMDSVTLAANAGNLLGELR